MEEQKQLKNRIDVAAGRKQADLVLKNGTIVDVYNGRLMKGDVAVVDGKIAGVGQDYHGEVQVDVSGKFLAPGLIDSHVHVESAYVTPKEISKITVPNGTSTIIADPHEIVNVAGIDGLNYMLAAAENTALDIKYMLPSCVPATEMEHAGARLDANQMKQPFLNKQILGLAEFMDFPSVIAGDDAALAKITAAHAAGKLIDGHSPQITGKQLNAYVSAGIHTEHECSTVAEMHDRISRGMYVFLREGSICHNLLPLLKGVNARNMRRCTFCCDDIQAKDIIEKGHINYHLKLAVKAGLAAVDAITMASLNAAECFNLSDRGALAPGLRADIVVFDDLVEFNVADVYLAGKHVAQNGEYLPKEAPIPVPQKLQASVNIGKYNLDLPLKTGKVHAVGVLANEALTKDCVMQVATNDGQFVFDEKIDAVKLAVIERHHCTGSFAVGILANYGLKHGAIAITIAHDAHNLIVAGTNDADMHAAVAALQKRGGGAVLVNDGKVQAFVPLQIGGLMSTASATTLTNQLAAFDEAAQKQGVHANIDPIMTLSFMSLEVIPELKLTDMGLFDVTQFKFVDINAE